MNQKFYKKICQMEREYIRRYIIHLLLILAMVFSFLFHTNLAPQINKMIVSDQKSQVHELNAGNLIANQPVQSGINSIQMNQSDVKTFEFKMDRFLCPTDIEHELLEYLVVFSYFFANCNRSGRLMKCRIGRASRIFRLIMNQYIQDKDGKKRCKALLNTSERR